MALPALDIVGFREFTTPEFDDIVKYPDGVVSLAYDYAIDNISNYSCLDASQLSRALWALMAHVLLNGFVGGSTTGNGYTPSVSSTGEVKVGEVTVKSGTTTETLASQSNIDRLELNSTVWGRWYLALISKCKANSFLIGSCSKINMILK